MLTSLRKSSSVSGYIVYRVSFIFRLNAFLVSVCTKGFAYLLCWPRGRGIRLLVCTRRFSFHEFYNFLLSNFLLFIFFGKLFLPTTFTDTHDPRPLPTTLDPRPLPTTLDPRHLATLSLPNRMAERRGRQNVLWRLCVTNVTRLLLVCFVVIFTSR